MSAARTSMILAISMGLTAPLAVLVTRADSQRLPVTSAAASPLTVCVLKKTGVMREARAKKPCRKNERTMQLNSTGPAGATGATGPAGPIGPAGPAGPAGKDAAGAGGAYYTQAKTLVTVNAFEVDVVSLALPAGRFMLTATTGATSASSVMTLCGLKGDSTLQHTAAYHSLGASQTVQLTTTGLIEAAGPTTVRLMCSNIGGTYSVAESSLAAIPLAK